MAAYDIVPHKILVDKLKVLGADNHASQYFENYLKDRFQQVLLDDQYSEELFEGPMLIVQGSTLSFLLYLVYILDLPILYQTVNPTVEENEKSDEPSPTTFVDNNVVTVGLDNPVTGQQKIEE